MLNECAVLFVWNPGTKVKGVSSSGNSEERWKNLEGSERWPIHLCGRLVSYPFGVFPTLKQFSISFHHFTHRAKSRRKS